MKKSEKLKDLRKELKRLDNMDSLMISKKNLFERNLEARQMHKALYNQRVEDWCNKNNYWDLRVKVGKKRIEFITEIQCLIGRPKSVRITGNEIKEF